MSTFPINNRERSFTYDNTEAFNYWLKHMIAELILFGKAVGLFFYFAYLSPF